MRTSKTKRKVSNPEKRAERIERQKQRETLIKEEPIHFIDEDNIDDLFSGLFKFPDEPYDPEDV